MRDQITTLSVKSDVAARPSGTIGRNRATGHASPPPAASTMNHGKAGLAYHGQVVDRPQASLDCTMWYAIAAVNPRQSTAQSSGVRPRVKTGGDPSFLPLVARYPSSPAHT